LRLPGWELDVSGKDRTEVSAVVRSVLAAVGERDKSIQADVVPFWINDGQHDQAIARFVQEGDEFVTRIVSAATNELKRTTRNKYLSFAAALTESGPEAAVEALYLHLKNDYHLTYEFERRFDDAVSQQFIRLPRHLAREQRGTCIDLVLLFLSCLANVKVWPVYIHIRISSSSDQQAVDHALAGFWIEEPWPNRRVLLDDKTVRDHISSRRLRAIDCTGFAEGYPGRQHKLAFTEAEEEATDLLRKHEIRFALDVRKAWESGTIPL
jgi:hypothetical protein